MTKHKKLNTLIIKKDEKIRQMVQNFGLKQRNQLKLGDKDNSQIQSK